MEAASHFIRPGRSARHELWRLESSTALTHRLSRAADAPGLLQRDYEKAREALNVASRLAPSDPEILNDLGTTYMLQGDFDGAVTALESALRIEPGEHSATGNLGTVYFFLGRYEDARELYEQALKKAPTDGGYWRNLGDAVYSTGDLATSKEIFRKAANLLEEQLTINPNKSEVLGSLAVAYASLDREKAFDDTVGLLNGSDKIYPGADYDIAVGMCRLQRLDECEGYAKRAAEQGFPLAFIRADPDLAPISHTVTSL